MATKTIVRSSQSSGLAGAYRQERLISVPVRWLLLIVGTLIVLTANVTPFGGGLSLAWLLYALVVLLSTILTWLIEVRPLGWLLWLGFAADVAFVSHLITISGGVSSPLYLIYGLLALKAVLLAPTLRQQIAWLPFLLGPSTSSSCGITTAAWASCASATPAALCPAGRLDRRRRPGHLDIGTLATNGAQP
ncbi:hypothetical protein [Candidatus Amarolinea dominans]|uniref:hypothetical protein n=1 Tax=Candidatus Amarolinea dominans TaxID=3140696 RepID=UPI003135E54E|nr:hypothetical protein [Anaerolineae bacterium]